MGRKLSWGVMTLLCVGVSAYALAVLLIPGFGPPFIAERRTAMPLPLYAHLFGGAIALGVGPFQFNTWFRNRYRAVHRAMGRVYLGGVLAGGLGGLTMATVSLEGLVTHVGFGMLAVLWLTSSTMALVRIRQGDTVRHREWMVRSFALTLAAVTLRIYLPLSQMAGVPFGEAYQVIAWFSWVPNLVVAEWMLVRRRVVLATA